MTSIQAKSAKKSTTDAGKETKDTKDTKEEADNIRAAINSVSSSLKIEKGGKAEGGAIKATAENSDGYKKSEEFSKIDDEKIIPDYSDHWNVKYSSTESETSEAAISVDKKFEIDFNDSDGLYTVDGVEYSNDQVFKNEIGTFAVRAAQSETTDGAEASGAENISNTESDAVVDGQDPTTEGAATAQSEVISTNSASPSATDTTATDGQDSTSEAENSRDITFDADGSVNWILTGSASGPGANGITYEGFSPTAEQADDQLNAARSELGDAFSNENFQASVYKRISSGQSPQSAVYTAALTMRAKQAGVLEDYQKQVNFYRTPSDDGIKTTMAEAHQSAFNVVTNSRVKFVDNMLSEKGRDLLQEPQKRSINDMTDEQYSVFKPHFMDDPRKEGAVNAAIYMATNEDDVLGPALTDAIENTDRPDGMTDDDYWAALMTHLPDAGSTQ